MRHLHFLPVERFRRMKGSFDDREEHMETVEPPSGLEVHEQVKRLEVIFGKLTCWTVLRFQMLMHRIYLGVLLLRTVRSLG